MYNDCFMTDSLVIDKPNVILGTRDVEVTKLTISDNKNVTFLPIKVAEKLPNIIIYFAYKNAIKVVSRENFAGLSKLTTLFLNSNQIEKITSDTFQDLISLENIQFSKKIE